MKRRMHIKWKGETKSLCGLSNPTHGCAVGGDTWEGATTCPKCGVPTCARCLKAAKRADAIPRETRLYRITLDALSAVLPAPQSHQEAER